MFTGSLASAASAAASALRAAAEAARKVEPNEMRERPGKTLGEADMEMSKLAVATITVKNHPIPSRSHLHLPRLANHLRPGSGFRLAGVRLEGRLLGQAALGGAGGALGGRGGVEPAHEIAGRGEQRATNGAARISTMRTTTATTTTTRSTTAPFQFLSRPCLTRIQPPPPPSMS